MRYFLWLVIVLATKYGNSQQVSRTFDKSLIQEEFETPSDRWEKRYTAIELMVVQDNALLLKRMSSTGFSVAFPSDIPEISKAEVITSFKLNRKTASSGGLVFFANQAGNKALLLEVSENGRFRVKKLKSGNFSVITKSKKEGWIKPKGYKKNDYNIWTIKSDNGLMDIYINGKFQTTCTDQDVTSGRIGVFANSGSSIEVDFLRINGASDDINNILPSSQNGSENAEILQLFKTKIEEQQKDIQKLQQDLAFCRSMSGIDTSARKANKDLTQKNQDLSKKVIQLEQELELKNKRLSYLENMKADLEKSQNGDIILNLTDLLNKEKNEHSATKELLQKQIEKSDRLQKEIDALKQ